MSASNRQRTDPTWNQLDAIVKKHGLEKLSLMDTADLIWRLEQSAGPAEQAPTLEDLEKQLAQAEFEKRAFTDALRYQWLRRAGSDAVVSEAFVNICESEPETPELFDAAIDAARSSATEGRS